MAGGPGRPAEHHSVVAIRAGDSYLGAVIRAHPGQPTRGVQLTLERAAQILALMILKQNAVIEADERVREELLTDVINAVRPTRADLAARAAARHLALDRVNALAVATSDTVRATELTRRLHRLSPDWSGLAGEYRGTATMVFHAADLDAAATAMHRRLRAADGEPILVCVALVPASRENLRRPFRHALRAAKILRAIQVHDKAVSTTHLGLYAVLFDPDRGEDLTVFIADTLGNLLTYDKRRGTDLVGTLAAYFDNSFNLTRTSKALHVHMNTLVKRMERIESVLGEDWQRPENSLAIQLAVRLHKIANTIDRVT